MNNYADFAVFVFCLVGLAFVAGMEVRESVKPRYECDPGYISARRDADGTLTCHYRTRDWRGVTVATKGRKG